MENNDIFNKSYELIKINFTDREVTYSNVYISLHHNSLIITDNMRKEAIFHNISTIKKIKIN